MKNTRIATAILLLAAPAVVASAQNHAQNQDDRAWHERLDSVVVSTSRASAGAPVTHSELGREALEKALPSGSMPQTLQLLPSVVSYNEGGTGLGNSAMTIRGVKGSQINVTLNGVTLNDSESQEVFWVNIPALTAIVSDVQVQRGLGTSANGSGAFGASINMGTGMVPMQSSGRVSYSAGSWGTSVLTLAAEAARNEKGFYGSAAYSRTSTDGYIRNARVRSQSSFVVLGWMKGHHSLRATWLLGDQVSGITWDGIDPAIVATDRTYNPAGEFYDEFGNVLYYPNAEDVYRQNHFQLNYTRTLRQGLTTSVTADYTRGDGYDEYYKTGRKFKDFGYPAAEMTGLDGNAYKKSDMTYRKRMDNDLYALNADLRWRSQPLDVTVGVSAARYIGGHWGEMLWAKVLGPDYDYAAMNDNDTWYRNSGRKTDLSAFARGEWRPLPWLTAFADLQLRRVHYSLTGRDDKASTVPMDYHETWPFFNPRGGVAAKFGSHRIYGSVALGHREPGKSDIKENIKGEMIPIRPESMVDFELGYSFSSRHLTASVSAYAMEYWDMLLETGKLSTSGYAIKENIDRGWRRGVELAAAYEVGPLRLDGNLTLSLNQIRDFTANVEDWENGGYRQEHYGRTPMLLSPGCVAMGRVQYTDGPRGPVFALDGKWVGKQYLDNTGADERSIPGYFVSNFSVQQTFRFDHYRLEAGLYINNLFDRLYCASGWTYRAWQGGEDPWYSETGLYPQAPRNWMLRLAILF